jgi:dimeric dUTPase (all-alpha-NTP-PPase superfamily)
MDKLERIFEMQEFFQKDLIARRKLDGIPTDKWIQMQTLAMLSELAELIDEVNFKWWKNPKPVDGDRVKEELVDILHFFVSMCLTSGMSAQELFDRYIEKNQENFDRQNGRSQKTGYESPAAEEQA